MRERVRELAQESEGEMGDICIHSVSGCAARQEAQQDGLELGEGGNGCTQKPRQRNSRNDAVSLLSRRSLIRRNPC